MMAAAEGGFCLASAVLAAELCDALAAELGGPVPFLPLDLVLFLSKGGLLDPLLGVVRLACADDSPFCVLFCARL
jgi:hypothetical protein